MDDETKRALDSLNDKINRVVVDLDRLVDYTNNLAIIVHGLDKQAKLIKRDRTIENDFTKG